MGGSDSLRTPSRSEELCCLAQSAGQLSSSSTWQSGGPYRLDRGHKVHQVSDEAKSQVSEEAAATAKNIAKKKLAERLKEIGMSETEYKVYNDFVRPLKEDIYNLRAALQATESRQKQ